MGKKKKSESGEHRNFVPIRGALDQAFSELDRFHEEGKAQIDLYSGYEFLNQLFVKLERPQFSIISVPAGIGGSSYLAGSIITELAIRFKRTIGILSMQISSPHFSNMMLNIVSNLDSYLIRTGRLPSEQWPELSKAAGEIANTNIYIDGTRSHSIKSFRKCARELMKASKPDLLVIDNLQFISRKRMQGRQALEYQQICHSLREVSEELDVSILLMSEFSNEYDADDFRTASDCTKLTSLNEYTRIADAELCLIPGESVKDGRLFNLHLYENCEGLTGTIELLRSKSGGGFKDRTQLPNMLTDS
jgi:replicative DNA helicase